MIGRVNSGAGGGGLSPNAAVLAVTAPVGSTITITKGGTSKTQDASKGHIKSDDNTLAVWYFSVRDFGTWTVTATLGGDTASDTVVINAADENDVELSYAYYLYKDGTQIVPFTKSIQGGGTQTITFGASSIDFTVNQNAYSVYSLGTTNLIDVTDYSTAYFTFDFTKAGTSGTPLRFGTKANTAISNNNYNQGFGTQISFYNEDTSSHLATTKSVDISSITGTVRIVLDGSFTDGSISAIYLKK